MTDKQIEAIERCNELIKDDHKEWMGLSNQHAIETVLNLLEKQHEQLERIKEYVHQEIAHYTEDIKDYMDDDKVDNAEYISELKENREHWKDIEKILEGKPNDDLYMNWWRYGLYE